MSKQDDDRHCSYCIHYEACPNCQMYCKALQRRITARKTPRYCKYYKINKSYDAENRKQKGIQSP